LEEIKVIIASIRMRPVEGKMNTVLRTIRGMLEPMRVLPGCLGFHCSRDIEDENMMILEERWETQKDLNAHLRSDGYRTILSLLEDSGEKPVVEFHQVAGTEGIEQIKKIRG
jgi:quinol monooxygenase YgiN